jgi:hypothetical protein
MYDYAGVVTFGQLYLSKANTAGPSEKLTKNDKFTELRESRFLRHAIDSSGDGTGLRAFAWFNFDVRKQ